MSFFKKSDAAPAKPRERGLPSSRLGGDAAISIIGPGMVIEGDIVTEGTVRVEGELRGTVRAGRSIIVGQEGRVDGSLVTEDAVIAGAVTGTIIARNRIELQSTCVVIGEIRTRSERLKLEEGASFSGHIEMTGGDQGTALPALLPGQSDASDALTFDEPRDGSGHAGMDEDAYRREHHASADSR